MRTALITGASSGIGEELAKIFASKKANVLLVARSEGKLHTLAEELRSLYGSKVDYIAVDLTEPSGVLSVYQYCVDEGITVDYLINNAGLGDHGFFPDSDWEACSEMLQLNMVALTKLCHLFVPDMKNRGFGRVMNVSSIAGFMPGPFMAVYYATKSYVTSFSQAIAEELKPYGISVTALCPGPTLTNFAKVAKIENNMFFNNNPATSSDIAAFGFEAMMNARLIAIPGTKNTLLSKVSGLLPAKLLLPIVKWVNLKETN